MLSLVETYELRGLTTSVFAIDLDQTGNEELLFLICLSLPKVGLAESDDKAGFANPVTMVGVYLRASERFDLGKIIKIPGLANREGAVSVLLGLVHTDTT